MANAEVRSAVTVMGNEPAQVSVEPVHPGAQPEKLLARLVDAVVLDAEEWGFESVIDWVRRFHEAYLERQVESAPGAWVNALHPTRPPLPVPPVLVVVTPPSQDIEAVRRMQGRIAAAGAVVYEKHPSESLDSLVAGLRAELVSVEGQFSPVGQSELAEVRVGQESAAEPPDLEAYVDPVYRLSREDFEALLDRGRIQDPLEVGE